MAVPNLHALPPSERPRERLVRYGVEGVSTTELLAILLSTGTKGKSVLMLAQELLIHFGGIAGLLEASIAELKQVKGVGKAKAIQLKAAFALARRCQQEISAKDHTDILSAEQAFAIAEPEIAHHRQEVLLVILRDAKGRLLHREQISKGTLSEVLVHPREVFYPAIKHKAHSMIIAHNHPSGDPTPSEQDLQLTRLLIQSSRVLGIGLDDHLIICPGVYVSLRKLGYFGQSSKY